MGLFKIRISGRLAVIEIYIAVRETSGRRTGGEGGFVGERRLISKEGGENTRKEDIVVVSITGLLRVFVRSYYCSPSSTEDHSIAARAGDRLTRTATSL